MQFHSEYQQSLCETWQANSKTYIEVQKDNNSGISVLAKTLLRKMGEEDVELAL